MLPPFVRLLRPTNASAPGPIGTVTSGIDAERHATKRGRRDADDGGDVRVEPDGLPDDARVAAEAALPVAVTEDGDQRSRPVIVGGREQAAQRRCDAQDVVHVGARELRRRQLGAAFMHRIEIGQRRERKQARERVDCSSRNIRNPGYDALQPTLSATLVSMHPSSTSWPGLSPAGRSGSRGGPA